MAITLFPKFSRSTSFELAFFLIGKWTLRFLGFWPQDPLNRLNKFKIVFNLTLLGMAIVGEVRFVWFLGMEDPLGTLYVVCPVLTKIVSWIKLLCFLIYRAEMKLLFEELYEHCKENTQNLKKNCMIVKVCFFSSLWCSVLFYNHVCTSCLFALKPLITWGYHFLVDGNGNGWIGLPFEVALPYEDMTQVKDKTLYAFIYCCLAHTGTITICSLAGAEGTYLCFCMYVSVSFQCLQEDFKRVFKTHLSKDINSSCEKVLFNNLTDLIRRQQKVIRMFDRFNEIYKHIVFFHFLLASITLAIVLVNLILISGASKLIYISYAAGAGNQLFTYCYGAESVHENCCKISEVLYFVEWYKCNKEVKHLLLFVLMKSQKGIRMKAPFFSPSLQLFASIIQKSGSYFTILQTIL